MKLRILFVAAVAAFLLIGMSGSRAKMQPVWPNLDVLEDYPNPEGDTCPLTGKSTATTEKKRTNALKNRYKLPADGFESLLLSQLMDLPSGTIGAPPNSSDPNQNRAVTVVGYVRSVKRGGSSGESCNCGATRSDLIDTHIDIVLNPNNTGTEGRRLVVAEVTERVRRLAREGLLQSNIGTDWSLANLKARLEGRWVKFSGYLFYDADHHTEAWKVDPNDNIQRSNWRQTGFEIHPVLSIETNVLPPADAERMSGRPSPNDDDQDDGDNPNHSSQPIIGNRNSRLYHLPGCSGYTRVSRRNQVRFRSENAAQEAGYRKAGNCS